MNREQALTEVSHYLDPKCDDCAEVLRVLSRPCIELDEGEEILESHPATIPIQPPEPGDWVIVTRRRS